MVLFNLHSILKGQYYFPPLLGNNWDTMSTNELSWCEDSLDALYDFLDRKRTKGFIILKDGKIVVEKYFNGHGRDSVWYWASAGKTMMAHLIGRAQEQNLLNITDSVSKFLGAGWTSMPASQEKSITIWHQLTMTTGLDYTKPDCLDPNCLSYRNDPGTFWYYHNSPYTLLRNVLEAATGKSVNNYMFTEVTAKTGITGQWIFLAPNNLLFSKTRSMARFGSLILNQGKWNGTTVFEDTLFLINAINTSQNLNKSYGYLWWLNGKESFRMPATTQQFNGMLMPNAPTDLYAGVGKNGQYVAIIPSKNMVVVRMGDNPDQDLVPTVFANEMFRRISQLSCPTHININYEENSIEIFPNPTHGSILKINSRDHEVILLYDQRGAVITQIELQEGLNNISLPTNCNGIYFLKGINYSHKIYITR